MIDSYIPAMWLSVLCDVVEWPVILAFHGKTNFFCFAFEMLINNVKEKLSIQ